MHCIAECREERPARSMTTVRRGAGRGARCDRAATHQSLPTGEVMRVRHLLIVFGISGAAVASAVVSPPAHAQLQPITTTNLGSTLPNVPAAVLRRPTTDTLGRAHVAVLIMHPHSGYVNFAACAPLAQRGFT